MSDQDKTKTWIHNVLEGFWGLFLLPAGLLGIWATLSQIGKLRTGGVVVGGGVAIPLDFLIVLGLPLVGLGMAFAGGILLAGAVTAIWRYAKRRETAYVVLRRGDKE